MSSTENKEMIYELHMSKFLRDDENMLIGYDRGKLDWDTNSSILSTIVIELFIDRASKLQILTDGVVAITSSYWRGFLEELALSLGKDRFYSQVCGNYDFQFPFFIKDKVTGEVTEYE